MWSAFLTRNDLLKVDNLPQELNNPSLKKAITVLEVMNFSEEERDFYEDHLKWLRIETNSLKKMKEEGKAEGLAEGKAEGRAEEKIEIAKNLLAQNIDIATISLATGLSIAEIEKLKS
jgi:predicted transposase/invertase (TIGR01784 family)